MSHENRNEDRLLSPKEASRLAGVSKKTLVRWEEDGLIEWVRDGPKGHRKYRERDILSHGKDSVRQTGDGCDVFAVATANLKSKRSFGSIFIQLPRRRVSRKPSFDYCKYSNVDPWLPAKQIARVGFGFRGKDVASYPKRRAGMRNYRTLSLEKKRGLWYGSEYVYKKSFEWNVGCVWFVVGGAVGGV